jgi:hypothetical protein
MGTLVRSINRQLVVAMLALAGLTCSTESGGPDGGHDAQVRVEAMLSPAATAAGVPLGQATLTVVSPAAETLLTQTVPYDSGMVVDLPVVLDAQSEEVAVTLTLLMAGTSPFPGVAAFRGHDTVTIESGAVGAAFPIAVEYIGPGANAAEVRITPRDTTVPTGDTLDFDASATDGAGGPLAAPFVRWSSTAVGSSVAPDGRFLAPAVRGETFILIRTPTGLTDSTMVRFLPPPAQVVLQGGNDQQGVVGDTLAQQLAVVVRAADALPVPGVTVTFAAAIGGGSVTVTSVVTDSLGVARSGALLGTTSGAQSFTATVAGVTPATFTATALPGAAHRLAFVVAPADSTRAGTVMLPAPVVEVRDTFGNRVREGGISIRALMAGVTEVTGEDSVVTDTTGRATFDSLVIGGVIGNDELRFDATGLVSARKSIRLTAGNAATIVKIAGDGQVAFLDSAVAVRPRVRVTDSYGNQVTAATVLWSIVAGSGSVTGANTPTDTLGEAAVGSWRVGSLAGENLLRARIAGVDSVEFTATGEALPPAISLTLRGTVVGVGRTVELAIALEEPAPAGGVTVTLTNSAPSVLTLDSTTFSFAEGDTLALAVLSGVSGGTTTIGATAPGYLSDSRVVTGSANVVNLPATSSVAYRGNVNVQVSLAAPAPVGGITVTVTSLDTTKVRVLVPSVTFNAGEQNKITQVNGVRPGATTLVATATGFVGDTMSATSVANLDILQGSLPLFATFGSAFVTSLRSGGVDAPAPPEGLTFHFTARDPGCVAFAVDSVVRPGGTVSAQDSAFYGGVTALPCTTYVVATAAGVNPDSIQVTVNPAPQIFAGFSQEVVGAGLQTPRVLSLQTGSHGGRPLIIRSLSPAKVLVAPNATTPAADSVQLFVANGVSNLNSFPNLPHVAGVEGIVGDSALVVFEMEGFVPDTIRVNVVAPHITLLGVPATRSTLQADTNLVAVTGWGNAGGLQGSQPIRTGGTFSRTATIRVTTNNGVARLYDSTGVRDTVLTVTFPIGQSQTPATGPAGVKLDALIPGVDTITVDKAGFAKPTNAVRPITVTPGAVAFADSVVRVGAGLMSASQLDPDGLDLVLSGPGHSGLEVSLKVLTPGVALVQATDSTVGSDSIGVTFAAGNAVARFFVAGLEGVVLDSVFVVASAPGVVPDTLKVIVRQPGLELQGTLPTMSSGAGDRDIFAVIGVPAADASALLAPQAIRPGSTLDPTVTFTLSAPGVAQLVDLAGAPALVKTKLIPIRGEITPFRVVTGGVGFDPLAPGAVNVTVTMPGVTTVGTGIRTVTVTP